jgi:hypothetical protein
MQVSPPSLPPFLFQLPFLPLKSKKKKKKKKEKEKEWLPRFIRKLIHQISTKWSPLEIEKGLF